MATLAQFRRKSWSRRSLWLWLLLGLVLVAVVCSLLAPRLGAVAEALTPPDLPELLPVKEQVWRDDQNWTFPQADEYHFKPQGTRTLPIPYSWFVALEQPTGSVWWLPFASKGRFVDNDYLPRFGFIPAAKSVNNPDGLPIGIAASPYTPINGLSDVKTAVGFTCAACHTGQLYYQGKQYVIEGGAAVTDLDLLTRALGAALGQTALSSKLPLFNGRFDRFAEAVLKDQYSVLTRNKLAADLESVVKVLGAIPNGIDVTEGFTRLDALNRIGNQVFAIDPSRPDNYVNINAPVNFPHIWTSSWFSWVQYDGSIMQPLVRNAGEAMGVAAYTNFMAPDNEGRSSNNIPIRNLHWIETQLAGTEEPLPAKRFNGLIAPTWPDSFPTIDPELAETGAQLYEKHCSGCHLPALTRAVANGGAPEDPFWNSFRKISWMENGERKETGEAVIGVKIVPHSVIGTDMAQANVLMQRTVNTAGVGDLAVTQNTTGFGINIDVCTPEPRYPGKVGRSPLVDIRVSDGPVLSYALALGAMVQRGINRWFDLNYIDDAGRVAFQGDRPNCLQAGAGYKARPLNGVWATAPFLHNGSVPTLMDLLSPVAERPVAFVLGNPTFDPVNVGVIRTPVEPGDNYNKQGYFVLDTRKPGNHNSGHEFADREAPGVIGPALQQPERLAIVEYLKTL